MKDSRRAWTRRSLRRGSALLALLALALAPRSSEATHFDVLLQDDAADLLITAFQRESVSRRLEEDIRDSPGYLLLFDQLALAQGRRGQSEAIADEFLLAVHSASDGNPDPGYELWRARMNADRYREALREYRRESGRIRWQITERLNSMLPPMESVEATAHLVVGGNVSGFAFSDRNDIAIRLDDFVIPAGRRVLDVDRLASVLGHELFHVAFVNAGGPPPRPHQPDRAWLQLIYGYGPETVGEVWRATGEPDWDGARVSACFEAWVPPARWHLGALDRFLNLLSRLQNEGTAVYVDEPLRDVSGNGFYRGEVDEWIGTIHQDFEYLAEVTDRFGKGAGPEEIEMYAQGGFNNNGPFYRIGYAIAKRIDSYHGRRPLTDTMNEGVLSFFETYFETHPYGPGQIDSATEEEIKTIIREIRAVGAFEPEEEK